MHSETKTVRMLERHCEESLETVKRHFGSVSPAWTCTYMNMIGVKEQLRRYEKNNLAVKALIRIFYVANNFGLKWGWRSFVVSCKEGLKLFKKLWQDAG